MEGMEQLKEVFSAEAEEILHNLEPDIIKLEEGSDPDVVNRIFRYVHTLKGSSGMAGFNDVSEFTHKLENLISGVRSGELTTNEKLVDILLHSMDWIKMVVFESDETEKQGQLKNKLLMAIDEYRQKKTGQPREAALLNNKNENTKNENKQEKPKDLNYKFFRIKTNFEDSIFSRGIDPLLVMENLVSLGRVASRRVYRDRLPDINSFDPEKCYVNWDITLRTKKSREEIEDMLLFVNDNDRIKIDDVTMDYKIHDKLEPSRIGEIMLSKNIITESELSSVLDTQETEGKKIAEIIIEKGYASQEDVNSALQEQDKIRKKIESATIRVATDKLDTLLNLLGEIIIGQSAISRAADQIGGEEGERVQNAVYGMDRTTREFQEQLMAIRMIPIGPSFDQFKRFVRDTAKEYGKEIKLELEGTETELDKTVIEKIGDPLKHMIRNSIDHGIETPQERIKSGKPGKGVIRLKAYHQEGNIFIEVSDDGRGIDKKKVRRKAEQMGLIKPQDEVSGDKLLSFLFLPGFSTAEKVGSLSGRGVGMDVVKTNIEQLKGTIKIDTEAGKSSTILIKLPLTMAIIDGMLIRVGKWKYIIPLSSIIESLQPGKMDVKTVESQGEVVSVRGRYVTLVRMYDLFGIEPEHKNPWESLIVIVESNGVYLGLMIDELIGQQQIVIKSLDSDITNSRAISGASILGDGSVSLIIDIHGLAGDMAA
ncbi:MAG: chemotaxis protein CheA [Spirochaetota bacterium]